VKSFSRRRGTVSTAIAGLQLDVLHKVIGFLAVTGWSDLLRTIAGQGR
jgi:hypothetical protein